MADNGPDGTSRYPGLAPPTAGGRRSRGANPVNPMNYSYMATPEEPAPRQTSQIHQSLVPGASLADNTPDMSQAPQDGATKDNLNFGWFSVPRPQPKQVPEIEENSCAEVGSVPPYDVISGTNIPREVPMPLTTIPHEVPSRTGSNVPREVPSRTGSNVPREVPSRTGSNVPREVPSRTGSNVPREVPSRTGSGRPGSIAPRDVPSRTRSTANCEQQDISYSQGDGLPFRENSKGDDDIVIDWPISSRCQPLIPPVQPSGYTTTVKRSRPDSRCSTRSQVPPPPISLSFTGYGRDQRPTFANCEAMGRRGESAQNYGSSLQFFNRTENNNNNDD